MLTSKYNSHPPSKELFGGVKCREQLTMGYPSPVGTSTTQVLYLTLREHCKEGMERLYEPEAHMSAKRSCLLSVKELDP